MESLKKRPATPGTKPVELKKLGDFLNSLRGSISSKYTRAHNMPYGGMSIFTDKQRACRKLKNKMAYRSRRVNRLRGV